MANKVEIGDVIDRFARVISKAQTILSDIDRCDLEDYEKDVATEYLQTGIDYIEMAYRLLDQD